jgi:hypothetical protein
LPRAEGAPSGTAATHSSPLVGWAGPVGAVAPVGQPSDGQVTGGEADGCGEDGAGDTGCGDAAMVAAGRPASSAGGVALKGAGGGCGAGRYPDGSLAR